MHRPSRSLGCISLLVAGMVVGVASSGAAEPQTWELRGGKYWEQVNPGATSRPVNVADETLDRIEQLITNGQYIAAKKQAIQWIKTHKDAPNRDRGVFLLGQANFGYGDRIQSFYNFDEVMDLYPDSRLFNAALDRQWDIADAYLKGYKIRFLGIPMFHAEDDAIEMLYRIQQRSPGSPLAERALLRTADYYYKTSQFDLAADVYAVFVRSYPRSPDVPRVRLRQAFSYYAQFRGLRFDATPIIDAREQLLNIIAEYPKLAEEENLAPVVARIDETFARKILATGHFYKRTHEPAAAAYTWRYLVMAYPKTPEAVAAQRELTHLPKAALKGAPPPAGSGYAPATQPSAEAR